ncbi:alpha/beta-hydrolase [Pleomassaria siparia CBS 279.74]|uniref:Alpha/beta-hydrolase n=1 Tax=Pleomassaria siparia CBS 279.74 TaxID=1314801 RepID=A0A6G1K7B2_9PLEO|nr:alpha/beta-hydrolase [Pleomassaria siparia CBS 279.74]
MAIILSLLVAMQCQSVLAVSSLTIETTSGPVTGLINGTTPNVAQFLGIPYAEPPVKERRWLPSILKTRLSSIDATRFGYSCPQFEGNASSVWDTDAPQFITPANTTGEDCLVANVWAPWNKNNTEKLPVIVWIYGGGFQTGGGNIEYQIPSRWIERSQSHIVVGVKCHRELRGIWTRDMKNCVPPRRGLIGYYISDGREYSGLLGVSSRFSDFIRGRRQDGR